MNTAKSIGIIIDGNRRWARAHHIPSLEGHRRGLKKVKEAALWAGEAGIRELTIYAFSTENWNRSAKEVNYLMRLFSTTIKNELAALGKEGNRIRFIGQRERLSPPLQKAMSSIEKETAGHAGMLIQIAISYGGRAEILAAVNTLLQQGTKTAAEEQLRSAMWSAGMSDPDIIIRTGGDRRLSNFLSWQSVYSELFFTKTYWPAFEKAEFNAILKEFSERERRHGR